MELAPALDGIPVWLFFVLALLGVFVGFVSGLVGIGGGVLIIPALMLLLPPDIAPEGVRLPLILGTTLAVAWLTSFAASFVHREHLRDFGREGYAIGLAAIVGAQVGAALSASADPRVIETVFAALLLVTAPLLAFGVQGGVRGGGNGNGVRRYAGGTAAGGGAGDDRAAGAEDGAEGWTPPSTLALAVAGLLVGTVSAAVGLGGALMTIPVLVVIMRYPQRRAMALSTMMMTLTAASATLGYVYHGLDAEGLPPGSIGYVNLAIGGALAFTAPLAARYGARLAHRIPDRVPRLVLSGLLLAVAAWMLLK